MRGFLVIGLSLSVLAGAGMAWADPALESVLAAPSLRVDEQILDRSALMAVYGAGQFEPLWKDAARAGAVAKVLTEAGRHGLNPEDYHLQAIQKRLSVHDRAEQIVLDLLLTDGLMSYASDVRVGRVSPRQVRGEQYVRPQVLDPAQLVLNAAAAQDLPVFLAELPPHSKLYWGMVQALEKLRAMPDWPQIADGRKLEPGDTSQRLLTLRQRLAASGELGGAAEQGNVFDDKLVEAVKAWQERNGLEPDGVVGRASLAMLNIPRSVRVDQIVANMERMRWLPDSLGQRYVMVNVPGYSLVAVKDGTTDLTMKTIVGRPARPTPIFSDTIRFVEFNPDWSIPPTIVREDVIPNMIKDPDFLMRVKNARVYRNGEEVDPWSIDWSRVRPRDYRFRAPPGPRNPLGTVKFLFPNRFDVYLHDTSEPEKFAEYERAFSSGCVRVSDPAGLANWLLADKEGWSDEKRQSILDSRRQTRLNMANPVPVWITYRTAWMDESGTPVFRPDIYGRDPDLAAAIRAASAQPRRLVVSMTRGNPGQPAVDPASLEEEVPQAAP